MKRILSLQMLAATMFSSVFHAQGHFDWVKTYQGEGQVWFSAKR